MLPRISRSADGVEYGNWTVNWIHYFFKWKELIFMTASFFISNGTRYLSHGSRQFSSVMEELWECIHLCNTTSIFSFRDINPRYNLYHLRQSILACQLLIRANRNLFPSSFTFNVGSNAKSSRPKKPRSTKSHLRWSKKSNNGNPSRHKFIQAVVQEKRINLSDPTLYVDVVNGLITDFWHNPTRCFFLPYMRTYNHRYITNQRSIRLHSSSKECVQPASNSKKPHTFD